MDTFNPSRVIILSELSSRDKNIYNNLLITQKAQFYRLNYESFILPKII